MKYFVANWKAHKNLAETEEWFQIFKEKLSQNTKIIDALQQNKLQIVICPPHSLLSRVHELVTALSLPNIAVGAQDVSSYDEGSYTGEDAAKNLEGLVKYVIIGHSERRRLRGETEEEIEKKIKRIQARGIEPLLCIRGTEDKIVEGVKFIVYEPVHAIGTGENEKPEEVLKMRESLHLAPDIKFFYGGSVNGEDIASYLGSDRIDGFFIGGASLDPASFVDIMKV